MGGGISSLRDGGAVVERQIARAAGSIDMPALAAQRIGDPGRGLAEAEDQQASHATP